jgi:hypothetical protein
MRLRITIKNKLKIMGVLKSRLKKDSTAADNKLKTARSKNHFLPLKSSSLAKYASKYPAGNAQSKIKI